MGRFADFEAQEFAEPEAVEAAPALPPKNIEGGNIPAMFNVNDSIAETMTSPPQKQPLPGDVARLSAPNDPERRAIALDASRADASKTETAGERSSRKMAGAQAGLASAVPFFPRIKGEVAGRMASLAESIRPITPGTVENSEFAGMQTSYLARKDLQRRMDAAAKNAPIDAAVASVIAGAATPMAGPLKVLGKVSGPARVVDSAAIGSVYGASSVDREGVTDDELTAGATAGAGFGVAGGLAGELLRRPLRNASSREDKAFIREIARTEGGEGSNALLTKNKVGIAKAYEDVIAQRHDPVIRKAVNMPEGKGSPILRERIAPQNAENAKLYDELDGLAREYPPEPKPAKEFSGELGLRGTVGRWTPDGENVEMVRASKEIKFTKEPRKGTVAKWGPDGEPIEVELPPKPRATKPEQYGPEPPKRVGLMNASRLEYELEKAKANVGFDAGTAKILDDMKADLREHIVPNVLGGKSEMTTSQFRAWLTNAQKKAENSPGGLNWTATYEQKQGAKMEASRIFNEYLDSIGAPKIVEKIRANNEKISPVLRIVDALEVKDGVEKLQRMGLGKLLEEQSRGLDRTGAIALALGGRPDIAMAIAAKPYVEKGVQRGLRWLNRDVLEPMNLLADQGVAEAKIARFGVERGLPQGIANEASKTFAQKYADKARRDQSPEDDDRKIRHVRSILEDAR
jgi:hypothetical protein